MNMYISPQLLTPSFVPGLEGITPLFGTDPRNRELSSLFATHPKMGPRKSFACHTYDTPHPRLLSRHAHSFLVASRTHLLAFFAPARLTLQIGHKLERSDKDPRDLLQWDALKRAPTRLAA